MTNLTPPRYLVIADYPNSPFNLGNILTQHTQFNKDAYFFNGNLYTDRHPEDYPHLFRLLHWWEYRELSDLPIYVKYSTKGKIIKVKWIYVQDGEGKVQLENGGYRFTWSFNLFEPATLNEYKEYIKNK